MAYTTETEVNQLLPEDNQVDTETYPTVDWLILKIPEVEATLNVALNSGGVTTPVTGDKATAYALLCAKELAFLTMQVRGATKDKESLWQQYHQEWLDTIKLLSNPETTTAGASSTLSPSSYTMDAPDNPDSTVNPVFKREQAHNW